MIDAWKDMLPTSMEIDGERYEIESDYRAILDILDMLADPELDNQEKAMGVLHIFYKGIAGMEPEQYVSAIKRFYWFLNGGEEETPGRRAPRLVSWKQDFKYIVAPINRVTGTEIRGLDYLHWFTFLSAYYEIGDCTFAQIVRIRNKKARGAALDKAEQEWYRNNRSLVDFKTAYTQVEDDLLKQWGAG